LSGDSQLRARECKELETHLEGKYGILKENELLRGLTYGQLLGEWLRWLHSSFPEYRGYRGEICYLRGNVSYVYDRETGYRKKAEPFHNRSRSKSDKIFRGDSIYSDTPIFIPVISSFYSVGEVSYDGKVLESIADCQYLCRRDRLEAAGFWCRIKREGCDWIDLKDKVRYIESPVIQMTVSKNSPLRNYFEVPIQPGPYESFSAAQTLIIEALPEGVYRLQYGGVGRSGYMSDSVHDFIVTDVEPQTGRVRSKKDSGFKFPEHDDDLEPL
jgi:hypothetical protein